MPLHLEFAFFMGWDGLKYVTKATKENIKTLLNFGKYTTFTLIGTNLLRSADTFIISFKPVGNSCSCLVQHSNETDRIAANTPEKFCCNRISQAVQSKYA